MHQFKNKFNEREKKMMLISGIERREKKQPEIRHNKDIMKA